MADPKIVPTKQMLDYRKEVEKRRISEQEKRNDYYQKTNPERQILSKRRNKLKKDRDLAAEAAIGYGLAIKAIEENMRTLDSELDSLDARIQSEAPPTITGDNFKVKFGVYEHEIDWSKAKL